MKPKHKHNHFRISEAFPGYHTALIKTQLLFSLWDFLLSLFFNVIVWIGSPAVCPMANFPTTWTTDFFFTSHYWAKSRIFKQFPLTNKQYLKSFKNRSCASSLIGRALIPRHAAARLSAYCSFQIFIRNFIPAEDIPAHKLSFLSFFVILQFNSSQLMKSNNSHFVSVSCSVCPAPLLIQCSHFHRSSPQYLSTDD